MDTIRYIWYVEKRKGKNMIKSLKVYEVTLPLKRWDDVHTYLRRYTNKIVEETRGKGADNDLVLHIGVISDLNQHIPTVAVFLKHVDTEISVNMFSRDWYLLVELLSVEGAPEEISLLKNKISDVIIGEENYEAIVSTS